MSNNFCYICGKKLVKIETGYYNVETGEKETVKQCPSSLCGHYGIGHEMLYKTVRKGLFSHKIMQYRRCGKIDNTEVYNYN